MPSPPDRACPLRQEGARVSLRRMSPSRASHWWLALGLSGLALAFANGRHGWPPLAWVAPALLLATMRVAPLRPALLGGLAAAAAASAVAWSGVVPLPGPAGTLAAAALGPLLFLPYAADRLLTPRLGGLMRVLVFPAAQVALEWGIYLVSPFASFGALAYTQVGWTSLIQLASMTGLWGVSFLVALAGSVGASLITERAGRKSAALLFGGSLAATLAFGTVRLGAAAPAERSVRVVGLAAKPADLGVIYATKAGCSPDCTAARQDARVQFARMLARTEAAAASGAQLISWSEVAGPVFAEDEPAAMTRLRALARARRVMLAPALWIVRPGERLWENKTLLIGPDGSVLASYLKSRPVPGDLDVRGPGVLPVVSTSLGRLALGICFDMDFPDLGRSAGEADLALVPGSDWAAIDPLHPSMVAMRAVENGYALIRPSRQSRSVAYDAYGRVLAQTEWRGVGQPKVELDAPIAGVTTLYERWGDWFALLCAAALLALTARATVLRDRAVRRPLLARVA